MDINITRDHTTPEEPYCWYDDRGDDPGWVLRYSPSEQLGQLHLDEPLTVTAEDATDAEILAAAKQAARFVGIS